jgi:hypothetical protein
MKEITKEILEKYIDILMHRAYIHAIYFSLPTNQTTEYIYKLFNLKNQDDINKLNFCITIASIGIATISVNLYFKEESDNIGIIKIIKEKTYQLNPYSIKALDNFLITLKNAAEIFDDKGNNVTLEYGIGNWIFYILNGELLPYKDIIYSYFIGNSTIKLFANWWQGIETFDPNQGIDPVLKGDDQKRVQKVIDDWSEKHGYKSISSVIFPFKRK